MDDRRANDLVDRVRHSCDRLVGEAQLLRIDDDRLRSVGRMLREPDADDAGSNAGSDAASNAPSTAPLVDPTLVFALDAINFGSGYHDVVRKRPGLSGARTMAAALTDYVSWTGPLTPTRLQAFTAVDCSQIFGQELDGGALEELMRSFASALQGLGHWLDAKGGTDGAIAAADGSAVRLATSLTEMAPFDDRSPVPGSTPTVVEFYKRAQITAADLARDSGVAFDDLDRLTAFADNLVPHVLRVEGALVYDDELAATIDRGELLPAGGRAELEIRAAGVVAVERLSEWTGERPMDIDLALWERGGTPRMKAVRRHRTRSLFY